MGIVEEYFTIISKYKKIYGEKTILLMQVGAFFEVYGKKKYNELTSILEFTQICDLNIANKNMTLDNDPVIMAGFKDIGIEKFLNKLQDAGFTTIVYVQDEQEKNTTRSLKGIFSPGTYFSNEKTKLTNNTMCIWIEYIEPKLNIIQGKRVEIGIANIDIYTGKTNVFQFSNMYVKRNPITYDDLERFVSIYNPNEVIIISNMDDSEINDVIQYTNIHSSLIHKVFLNNSTTKHELMANKCEKQTYQKEVISRFYPTMDFSLFVQRFYEQGIAIQSLCFLLDFVYQHNPFLVDKISEPNFDNVTDRLILANHSLQQLNIIDDNVFSGKYSSVLKMLNVCITSMGKRHFRSVFLNPISNCDKLEQEYNITDYLIQKNYHYTDLYSHLENIQDISKWSRQIILKKVSPKVFYQLTDNIDIIRSMYKFVEKDSELYTYLDNTDHIQHFDQVLSYGDSVSHVIKTNLKIHLCKDIDDIRNTDINFIQKGINDQLDEVTTKYIHSLSIRDAIQKYLNGIIGTGEKKGKNTEYVKLHETEKSCAQLITTKRRCNILKSALPSGNITIKFTSSSDDEQYEVTMENFKEQVSFPTQSGSNNFISCGYLQSLYSSVSGYKNTIKELVSKAYNDFLDKMVECLDSLETLSQFVTYIDMLYAKITIARKYNLCKPEIDNSAPKAFVDIKNLRHCLIENIQHDELYVANDIVLGKSESQDGVLLYGTNAVGKTSFIRAIGISVIMAQAGLYVPASEFTYKPYTAIFTRILGNDNIFKGLSTFAVEMSELRNILLMANENSLILGDELCSGTESVSAQSIFVAGIQHLHSVQSSFIFATHLHEIINYSEILEMSRLVLKHMEVIYDRENDVLRYDRKLKDGSGTNTYGLEVCKSLSLPNDFMENAHAIRMKYNPETASILSFKSSHFNAKKIMGLCEKCNKTIGTEVHHLQHQTNADQNGFITQTDGSKIHKNKLANLMTLCEKCHLSMHTSKSGHKRIRSNDGYSLSQL